MKEFETDEDLASEALEPFEFGLRGIGFKAKPRFSPSDFGAWTELVNDLANGIVKGNPFTTMSGIIERTLLSGYREKWDDLMGSDLEVPIKFDTLIEIGNAIVEHSTNRPTQVPPPSGNSDENGGTRSTEDSATRVRAASSLSRPTES